MNVRDAFVLTAVGTSRGRVSRPELCLQTVETDVKERLLSSRLFDRATFQSISVVIHLGEASHPPKVWGVSRKFSELEVAVGIPFSAVKNREPLRVCEVVREAAVAAVLAGLEAEGLLDIDLRRALDVT
jgi:hypothetical protein